MAAEDLNVLLNFAREKFSADVVKTKWNSTAEQRTIVARLVEKGVSNADIKKATGISDGSIRLWSKKSKSKKRARKSGFRALKICDEPVTAKRVTEARGSDVRVVFQNGVSIFLSSGNLTAEFFQHISLVGG